MAINRLEYPITFDEAIGLLLAEAKTILEENRAHVVLGDPRPEVLMWAAARLTEHKNLVLASKNAF